MAGWITIFMRELYFWDDPELGHLGDRPQMSIYKKHTVMTFGKVTASVAD
jgi:hypothetical protein